MINTEGLEGREFIRGKQDCFDVVRTLYAHNFDIHIRNYARPSDPTGDSSLIMRAFAREGFEQISNWRVDDLRPADLMCICIGSAEPNHFAVYLGDNKIVHHIYGQLSRVEPLQNYWLHYTAFLLRHPLVPDLRPKYEDKSIEELLRERYKVQTEAAA